MRKLMTTAALVAAGSVAFAGTAFADGTMTWTTANTTATGDQDNSAVASVRTGYSAVVWEDDRDTTNPADNLHSDIWLRLYQDGVSLYEKKLSASGTGNWRHVQPDVSLHESGVAVVTWAEDPDGNGVFQIAVREVNTAGTVTGSATANANSAGQQTLPSVAADPDGTGFAVAFDDKQSTTPSTVRLSGYASITSKTYEVQVHAAGGTHARPDVAMGAAQNAIVVWDEDGDANGSFNIARKSFTSAGAQKLAQAVANVNTGGQQRHASVAANFNGDFVVGWETDHTGTAQIGVRSYSATGTAGPETVVPGVDPQVGIDDQTAAAVGWVDAQDIYVQGINADGTTTGRHPRTRVNTTITGRQDEAALTVDPWGQVIVAYTDDNDGNLFDQVYLGTGITNSTW